MKPFPIRLRLTLWYFVMFTVAALLLSLSGWWMLRRTVDASVHQDLQERIDDISTQLHQFGANADPQLAQKQFASFYRDRDDGKWLQILNQDGRWIYRSARMTSSRLSLLPRNMLPRSGIVTDFTQGTHNVRALSVAVVVDGHPYTVQTGISLRKPHALLHSFGLGLLLLTPAVLLPAAIGGHVMSRKALAPVAAIAHEVRRITDRNLDRRLPVSETSDELSHLSITLNSMLERIDIAFRSVRDFTANASHELRTPLARLRTETEIALMRPREARAEAGSEVLRLTPTDLGDIVQEVANEWAPIVDRLSLRFQASPWRVDPDRPQVLGDRTSLVRLLRILLDNACKFTPPGGSIAIRLLPEGNVLLLQVEDTGIGIAPEQQQRIFDRFYRVDGDTAKQSGAGLGLSLAAWIAEHHKTRIKLESTLGRGSRFTVALTRVAEAEALSQTAAPSGASRL
jgi:signal transduction histidine kinase